MISASSQFVWNKPVEQAIRNAAKRASLSVGIRSDATYPNGEKVEDVAFAMEFGDGKIPPRPFMREAIARDRSLWLLKMLLRTRKVLDGRGSIRTAFRTLGEKVKESIVESIEKLSSPVLKPSTVARKAAKGRERPEKPLVDSGLLKNSFTVEVSE